MNNVDTINSIIKNHVKHKCDPYSTTEGAINNKEICMKMMDLD